MHLARTNQAHLFQADDLAKPHQLLDVHTKPAEAHSLTINNTQQLHGFTFNAGFFKNFFHGNFTRRISDIGPTGWVQPNSRISSLHEKYFAIVVTHNCTDRNFWSDVTRDSLAN